LMLCDAPKVKPGKGEIPHLTHPRAQPPHPTRGRSL
jgi:hypothetical protein